MTVTTRVHVMRHGEVHNPEGVLYGRLPGYRLSDRGQAQARAVADALGNNDIAVVIASPLQRAQETAAPIAARHGLSIGTDEDLIESANFFEGKRMSPGDGVWRHPKVWWQVRNPFTPSWGEPYREIAARMSAALERARLKGEGREVVCVSHQLPVETLRRHMQGVRLAHDPRRRQCNLASLTTFTFTDDRLTDVSYSEPAAGL
ncbi:histidine phosphatase family protein [[Mycobacterium] wendilense]|uniref:Histidine phosphatase family protein n=2 Tax=[Mycobacterium] wendilense TaxID=3064284 RepID=A0ABM9MHW1_9MYCO|nr:histidine phosphatase family protein [Mycolicibacterium sp. MU0050]CAJ1585573.1 histidine phosphatase family protein [Mycolicibacterium sp. MU0050]